jgi:hypothetical protein
VLEAPRTNSWVLFGWPPVLYVLPISFAPVQSISV